MKRIAAALLLLLPLCSLSAGPALGYSLAPVGEMNADGSYGALDIALFFSFDSDLHAGDIEVSADISPYGRWFQGVNMRLSTPVFATADHPFNVLFPNTVLWTPKVSVGASFRMNDDWSVNIGIAPFAFQDIDYIFEFFSPYVLYSVTRQSWGWGMYILRFSYFFGLGGGR